MRPHVTPPLNIPDQLVNAWNQVIEVIKTLPHPRDTQGICYAIKLTCQHDFILWGLMNEALTRRDPGSRYRWHDLYCYWFPLTREGDLARIRLCEQLRDEAIRSEATGDLS